MIKKLLIICAFFAVTLALNAADCPSNKVQCCTGGQKSCCSPLPACTKAPCTSYDISCWGASAIVVCGQGQSYINGKCVDNVQEIDPGETIITCPAFTSPAGHSVPATAIGSSVSISCYTYTCSISATWQTTSNCECKPNATYYEPCGSCGTRSRTCSASGTFNSWSSCSSL